MYKFLISTSSILIAFFTWTVAGAQSKSVPNFLSYQSSIFDDGGNSIPDGELGAKFKISDSTGAVLYEENQTLEAYRGAVSALIGNGFSDDGALTGGVPANVFDPTDARFLEVQINGMSQGSPMEIASVPYSVFSNQALGLAEGAADSKSIADGSISYADLSRPLIDKLIDELTGGRGADAIVFKDSLDTLYRAPQAASTIGVKPGLIYSGANDLQGVLGDMDVAIKRRDEKITTESETRGGADTVLQTNINDEGSARTAADVAEATTRNNGDSALQTNINNEAAARSSADTTLQTNINNEATARAAADAAEASTRSTADSNLQSNIDAEVTARQIQADNNLAAANVAAGEAAASSTQGLRNEIAPMLPKAWGVIQFDGDNPPTVTGQGISGVTLQQTCGAGITFSSPINEPYAVVCTVGEDRMSDDLMCQYQGRYSDNVVVYMRDSDAGCGSNGVGTKTISFLIFAQ